MASAAAHPTKTTQAAPVSAPAELKTPTTVVRNIVVSDSSRLSDSMVVAWDAVPEPHHGYEVNVAEDSWMAGWTAVPYADPVAFVVDDAVLRLPRGGIVPRDVTDAAVPVTVHPGPVALIKNLQPSKSYVVRVRPVVVTAAGALLAGTWTGKSEPFRTLSESEERTALKKMLPRVQNSHDAARKELIALQQRASASEARAEELRSQLTTSQAKSEGYLNELKATQERVTKLDADKSALRNEMTEAVSKRVAAAVAPVETRLAALTTQMQATERELVAAQQTADRLRQELDAERASRSALESELGALQTALRAERAAVEEARRTLAAREAELSANAEVIRALEASVSSAGATAGASQAQLDALRHQLQTMREDADKRDAETRREMQLRLDAEADRARQEQARAAEAVERAKAAIRHEEDKCGALTSTVASLRASTDELRAENARISNCHQAVELEALRLRSELETAQRTRDALQLEIAGLRDEATAQQGARDELEHRHAERIRELNARIEVLEASVAKSEQHRSVASESINILRQDRDELVVEVEGLKAAEAARAAEMERLLIAVRDSERQAAEAGAALQEREEQLQQLRAQQSDAAVAAEREVQRIRASLLQEHTAALQAARTEFEERLRARDSAAPGTTSDAVVQDLRDQLKQCQRALKVKEDQLGQLRAECDMSFNNEKAARSELVKLEGKLGSVEVSVRQLETRNRSLEQQLQATRTSTTVVPLPPRPVETTDGPAGSSTRITELERALNTAERRVTDAERAAAESERLRQTVLQRFEAVHRDVTQLRTEYARMEAQRDAAESSVQSLQTALTLLQNEVTARGGSPSGTMEAHLRQELQDARRHIENQQAAIGQLKARILEEQEARGGDMARHVVEMEALQSRVAAAGRGDAEVARLTAEVESLRERLRHYTDADAATARLLSENESLRLQRSTSSDRHVAEMSARVEALELRLRRADADVARLQPLEFRVRELTRQLEDKQNTIAAMRLQLAEHGVHVPL